MPPMDLAQTIAAMWEEARPRLATRLQTLEDALRRGDREAAAAEAHTLTGTLGTFGEHEGSDAARELETALRDGGEVGAPLATLQRVLLRAL
jgi:HPt (histidine-containing phosphotransfer) domain-containing protein